MTLNQTLISATTISTPVASVTIPVPSGYTDLRLSVSTRTATGGAADMYVSFNSDTNQANYSMKQLQGNGSSVSSSGGSSNQGTVSNGSTDTALSFSSNEIYVPEYASSNRKSFSVDSVTETNATTAYSTIRAVTWNNTAAITSISFANNGGQNFATGSTFTLYGISMVGASPVGLPKATGGDIVKNDGTYWYHAFLSTGTFIPQQSLSADVLVIAGGGGAGDQPGAGAGGVIYQANKPVSSQTAIIVGAGGAGSTTTPSKGSDSFFGAMKAFGGGAGYTSPLNIGGSGGGTYNTLSDYGTSNQTSNDGGTGYGNRGGAGTVAVNYRGGGGGGAGTPGKNNNDPSGGAFSTGGAGGDGLNTWASWLSATSLGVNGYIAGGGGSGAVDNLANNGGLGGGGNGGQSGTSMSVYPKKYATSAVVNTGSGGGGGGWSSDGYALGGNGGSGLVIIRYAMA